MKTSVDVPVSYRKALAGIDYTSPVCKINVAVNKIPNFLANPNTSPCHCLTGTIMSMREIA